MNFIELIKPETEELKAKRNGLPSELEVSLRETDGDHLVALLTVMSVCNKAQMEPITTGNVGAWRKLTSQVNKLDATNSITIQSLLHG